jgi:GTP pyrophosphokinase
VSFSKVLKTGDLLNSAKDFSFETLDDFFASVGYGLHTPLQVLSKLIPETEKPGKLKQLIGSIKRPKDTSIKVKGIDDGMVVRFAKCCNPIPGDKIFGFITRGRGITVHTEDCSNTHVYDEQRKVEVSWELNKNFTYPVKLKISGDDRKGLISDISAVMSANKVNILSASAMTYPDRSAAGIFEIEIGNMPQLQKIMKSIQKIKGVRDVERMRSSA